MHIVGTESCLLLVFSLLCSCFTLLRVLYDKIWMLLHVKQLSLRVKAGFRMTLKWNWLIHSFIHHLCPSWTVCLPVSQFSNSHCLRLSVPFSVDHGLSTCLCLSFQAVTVSDSQCLSLSIMDCLPAWVSLSALKLSLSQTLSAFLCPSWTVYLPVSQLSSCHCLRLSVPFSVHHGLSACLGLSSQAVTVWDSQCLSLSHSQEKVTFYYVMLKQARNQNV